MQTVDNTATSAASSEGAFRSTILIVGVMLAILMAVPLMAILFLVGAPFWIGAVLAVLATALVVWRWVAGSTSRVTKHLGLQPALVCHDPRLVNLVEGLSLSIGTDEPALYVLDDPSLNALSVVDSEGASIVMTSGLLAGLGLMELEGVVAESLVRIKSGDAKTASLAAGTFGSPFMDGPFPNSIGKWGISRLLTPDSDIAADRLAVGVTRYPPGLLSALVKISDSYDPAGATAGNNHLWVAPPLTSSGGVPHSPLEWRIDILTEY